MTQVNIKSSYDAITYSLRYQIEFYLFSTKYAKRVYSTYKLDLLFPFKGSNSSHKACNLLARQQIFRLSYCCIASKLVDF